MSASELHVRVNGTPQLTDAGTVGRLLEGLGYPASVRGVAVARNGEIVPRSRWFDESLQEDDEIEIVGAAQGG